MIFITLMCYNICMKDNGYIHDRTCVYNVKYHLIWCTKYRKKVLINDIEDRLYEIINEICKDKSITLIECKIGEGDHIHCFVSAAPKLSITAIIKYLKGISGIKLLKEFPELRKQLWKGELWSGSYFVETIGSTSEENIKWYIERQKNVQM